MGCLELGQACSAFLVAGIARHWTLQPLTIARLAKSYSDFERLDLPPVPSHRTTQTTLVHHHVHICREPSPSSTAPMLCKTL